jgi:putative ABC transport system substrate-binding protein
MVSYGQKTFGTGEQAARLAQRILEGVPPSELPVEVSEFYLGVNLRTARAIGIRIADDILLQADDIAR